MTLVMEFYHSIEVGEEEKLQSSHENCKCRTLVVEASDANLGSLLQMTECRILSVRMILSAEIPVIRNFCLNTGFTAMLPEINHVVFGKQRIRGFPVVLPLQFDGDCFTIRGAQRGAVIIPGERIQRNSPLNSFLEVR